MVEKGQCLCGKIKVTVKDGSLPLQTMVCHCYSCRTTAGSAYSMVSMINLDDLEISGTPSCYGDSATGSGATIQRHFCGNCGSPIHSQSPNVPGKTFLKLGVFAGKKKLGAPVAEVYWKNHEDWEKQLCENVKQEM
ncbi:uncharacterized protein FA14DRAFT_132227 [Meira miltonrushii]|uniref:CENP-V/GFA domain-containing protein n=1 Tax=Meira miltonrushii TaxID=1280837 RepID=A0A316VGF7_9BASI|nr:uncharacterized protein FA14DRAFT_132227 [Meira miltonrushii]PWN34575.1 hypothetical protein FA14DRAFT_132227 [Meira miltonrushii]